MADRVPPSRLYRAARERACAVASQQLEHRPVPATPGWTVHDVVAHLTGVAQDLVAGWAPTGGPTAEWTAGHVARGRDVPLPELLQQWASAGTEVERLLDQRPVWPVVMDAGAHELDIRAAVGDTGGRDTETVTVCARMLLKTLQVPAPLLIETDGGTFQVGPHDGAPVRLRTTLWEAFRWRLRRRSRAQLLALDWSADPTPFLDALCVFGPAEQDVLE